MRRTGFAAVLWLTGLAGLARPVLAANPESLELFIRMPLSVSLFADAAVSASVVSVGQTFMVCMTVSNSGALTAPNVTAAIWKTGGGGAAAISAANPPVVAGLPSGAVAIFTWTVTGAAAGPICWSGTSSSGGTTASAPVPGVCAVIRTAASLVATLAIDPPEQVRVFSTVTAVLSVKNAGQTDMQIVSIDGGVTDPLSLLGPAAGFPLALPLLVSGGSVAVFTWTYQAVDCGAVPAIISATVWARDQALSQAMPPAFVEGSPVTAATIPTTLVVNVLNPVVKVAGLSGLTVAVYDSCVPAVAMVNETVALAVVSGGGQIVTDPGVTDAAGIARAVVRTGYLPGRNAFLVSGPGLPGTTVFVEGTAADVPTMYLSRNFLNPARGEKLQVRVTVPVASRLSIRVYNLAGELVRAVKETDIPPGLTVWEWDGRNEQGASVGNGTYFIPIETGGAKRIRQITVMSRE